MDDAVTTRITRRTHTLAKRIAKDQDMTLVEVFELAIKEMRKELFYKEFNMSTRKLKETREAALADEEKELEEKLRKIYKKGRV